MKNSGFILINKKKELSINIKIIYNNTKYKRKINKMSSNFNVMFSYEEIDKAIKCGGGEKMSSIFERFAKEINSEVNDYNFYYKKEKIEVNSNKNSFRT